MASCFASVSEKGILKINEERTPLNTKKATKLVVSLFDSKVLFFSILISLMLSLVLVCEIDCGRLVVKLVFAQILIKNF